MTETKCEGRVSWATEKQSFFEFCHLKGFTADLFLHKMPLKDKSFELQLASQQSTEIKGTGQESRAQEYKVEK